MVDVLCAYWKVAKKRFLDNVRQCLDTYFVGALLTKCTDHLTNLIGLSDTRLGTLIVESPALSKQREELLSKEARLTKAQREHTRWQTGEDTREPQNECGFEVVA